MLLKNYWGASAPLCPLPATAVSLRACHLQQGQFFYTYASRSLTDSEANYTQIKKETLAIVFAAKRRKPYIYGCSVLVDTDHKPLESIFKKDLNSTPKRLQRMMQRLQKFDLTVSDKKGKKMYLADTLSLAFAPNKCTSITEEEDIVLLHNTRGETEKDVESINTNQ